MGWGIKKSYRIGPFKINLSKSAVGISAKMGPFSQSINTSSRGRTSMSIPKTGVFYRKYETFNDEEKE